MEVPGGLNNKVMVCICEIIGTAFLLIAVNISSNTGVTPMCVGFTVFAMATIIGPVSGGHMNPAVTIGMFIKHKHEDKTVQNAVYMVIIICSQLIGGMLGVSIASGAADGTVDDKVTGQVKSSAVTMLCPNSPSGKGCYSDDMTGRIFVGEMIATFLFVSFVLQVVKHNGAVDAPVNTIAIGLCLFIAITLTSAVSGGCVNPAVGFVQPVFQRIFYASKFPKADPVPLTYYAAYIFAPALGGVLAGVFQKTLNEFAQGKAIQVAEEAKGEKDGYAREIQQEN